MHSSAANTVISATIEAPELTGPAVITQPANGTIFTSTPITVAGNCPDNSYIVLYRNGQLSGVDICSNNIFQIQTDLFSGGNQLLAQDYNTTNEAGPQGATVSVTYNSTVVIVQSTTPVQTSTNSSSSTTSAIPLLVNTQFQYQAMPAGQQFSWNLNLSGGIPPYNIIVNWGDGSQSSFTFNSDPTFTITHKYQRAGNYVIDVNVKDFTGSKTFLQLVAIIHSSLVGPAVTGTTGSTSVGSSVSKAIRHYTWVAWPSYVIVVALVFSFWLGEHEEIRILTRRKRPAHR